MVSGQTAENSIGRSPGPTEEDVAFYAAHGWWISPPIFSADFIDAAAESADRFYRQRDRDLPYQHGYANWTWDDGADVVRNNEFVSLQSDDLRAVACQPILGEIAARLAGVEAIRLLDDQLVDKPPRGRGDSGVVGWHADHAYWGTCSSDRLLTAWIAFCDVDEENGTLEVVDGSHRWPDTEHARFFNDPDLGSVAQRFGDADRPVARVAFRMQKGQVSFHHGWTLHASRPNRSATRRLALAVHLQDGDNRYRSKDGPDGRPVQMFDEQLCRRLANGDPDFADPAIFPTVWSQR